MGKDKTLIDPRIEKIMVSLKRMGFDVRYNAHEKYISLWFKTESGQLIHKNVFEVELYNDFALEYIVKDVMNTIKKTF